MPSSNKDTALLTPSQREYLRGESDIEEKSSYERAIRARIRDRLRNGIFDLSLLKSSLEARDVEKAFSDDYDPEAHPAEWRHVFNNIGDALALIFDGTARSSKFGDILSESKEPNEDILAMYADFIEQGIEAVFLSRGASVENVEVKINLELGDDLSDLSEQNLVELSERELKQLLASGEISVDKYTEVITQKRPDVRIIEMDSEQGSSKG